jgi:transposase-like protein
MTHYQLTLDHERVQRLFGESERLRQLLEAVVNQVLEAQVAEHVQAEPYERAEERRGYGNGYKSRQLTTRVGALQLRVPQVRDGSFSPERSQRGEQALVQFQGASWQRCQTHLSATISDATPTALQDEVHRRVRSIFEAPAVQTARLVLEKVSADFLHRAPAAVATLERGFDDATAVLPSWPCPRSIANACARPTPSNGSTKRSVGVNGSSASSRPASP